MLEITTEYKQKVVVALLEQRKNFDGTDSSFAKQWGLNSAIYSRIKNGEIERVVDNSRWITIGRELDVSLNERKWKMAKTAVYDMIEEDVVFCQEFSKSKMCVDDCGIGKSFSAKYLSRNLKNCFYVDASQAKTKQQFIRLLAKTIGIDFGKYYEMKANIKHYLKMLPHPVVIIDEAGDLEYNAFLELKEFWNATEGVCGWYLIGADGLREKISRGINSKKVGFRELFSRYSEKYTSPVPHGVAEREAFYAQLITDVLSVNMKDKSKLNQIVKRCLTKDENGNIGGLRRAESLLIIAGNGESC
jgi:hypothetical protein